VSTEAIRPKEAAPTTSPPIRGAFVSWAKLRRADTIAAGLGIPSHTIKYFHRGTPLLLTLCKYFLQTLRTLWILAMDRPRVVLVTCPPVFAMVPVFFYAVVFRARYVIDFHSGSFLEPEWRRWQWLQRFFARRATLSLVHNSDNARVAEEWGIRHLVFPSLPPDLPAGTLSPGRGSPEGSARAVYICSFKSDEPVDALLEAARKCPQVALYITGRAPEGLASRLPPNVKLTGFLSEEDYNDLLAGAEVVIALTTRPGTLLYGAQEAIALGKPLVLSRTPTLETHFTGAAVFSDNTADALRAGILDAVARRSELEAAMREFRARYAAEGQARLARLREAVGL